MAYAPRTIYLGLRSNTQYFASKQGFMKLDARLKTLALLYDHLVLEEGVYDCSVGPGGSTTFVTPYQDPAQLKPVRTLKHNFRVGVALTGSDQYDQVINSPTEKRYRAQFESTLQQLDALNPDWLSSTYFDATDDITREADNLASTWIWQDTNLLTDFMPEASHWLRDVVIKSLYIDVARAYLSDVDVALDGFHSALIGRKVATDHIEESANGKRTLRLLVPNVAVLGWEDINVLRKDIGISNLREKLSEFDAAGGSDDDLLRRANEEYQDYMEGHRPRWSKVVAAINWSLLGFTPLSPAAAVAQPILTGNAVRKAQKHWTASFIRVRRYIEKQTEKRA